MQLARLAYQRRVPRGVTGRTQKVSRDCGGNQDGDSSATDEQMSEHAVIVQFQCGSTDSSLFRLEVQLESGHRYGTAGEYDGNEIAATEATHAVHVRPGRGPPRGSRAADPGSRRFHEGARITKRYGPPEDGVREVVVDLGS